VGTIARLKSAECPGFPVNLEAGLMPLVTGIVRRLIQQVKTRVRDHNNQPSIGTLIASRSKETEKCITLAGQHFNNNPIAAEN
jgi:hypothetical protein